MISFRYHLVTIVAVFLALGLGVVAGTTVVDQGLVSRLEEQTASANRAADEARAQRDALQTRVDRAEALATEALPELTRDHLVGRRVVVLSDRGATGQPVDAARRALEDGGASITATLGMTSRLTDPDEDAQAALADLLDLPVSSDVATLQAEAEERLADRLEHGPAAGGDDFLVQMLDAGFLEAGDGNALRPEAGVLPGVGGPGQAVVVVTHPDTERPADREPHLMEAAQALIRGGVPTVVAGLADIPPGTPADLVIRLRESGPSDGEQYVTVDDVDEAVGRLALVLGLEDLLRTGEGGDYGFRAGRDALLPSLQR